jgi:BASS family bile acid:Na+ symporter
VTAANAEIVRMSLSLLVEVGGGIVTLNGLGYAVGSLVGSRGSKPTRIAAVLSIGIRDFAAAAALVTAAGLPMIASLPAVAFDVVEMATSAGLVE